MRKAKLLTAALSLIALQSFAQEPTFMDAATHPGAGQIYARLMTFHSEMENAGTGNKSEETSSTLKLAYGMHSSLALLMDVNALKRKEDGDEDTGFSLVTLRLKQRVLQRDLGPLNTWRASVIAGADIPGTRDELAPEHVSPRVGAATTAILGRHGLNAQIEWTSKKGEPDLYAINASHLFRIQPAEFAADTAGAWYTMLEILNDVDSDGASRSDIAAGLLYEARRWAAEASVRLPVADHDWPVETDYTVALGLRKLF